MRGRFGAGKKAAIKSANVAQLAEHVIGNDEVSGSIPDIGSRMVVGVYNFLALDDRGGVLLKRSRVIHTQSRRAH